MFVRVRIALAAVALIATACSGTTGGAEPVAATTTSVAATTTQPPATTTQPSTTTTGAQVEVVKPADPEGVGDSFYPKLGNPGYDALHYNIHLNVFHEPDVEPAANTISALTEITARATEELAAFNLDLSGLKVEWVTVDGADARSSRSGHELTVEPENPIAAGSVFAVRVGYSGSPEALDDPGVSFFKLGWQQQDGVIFTVSGPSGSMSWFPSNNHPTDKATFDIQVTVPEGLTAASNGLLIDEATSDGRTTFTWQMDDPMATYLAAVYIGDFERIDHGPLYEGGPVWRDYVPADAPPEIAQALSVTPDVIAFLENLLGPYPFDAYGTIVTPFPLGFALGNQTLSIHGPATIGPGVIAHEAAHQWLGNSVTLDDWSETWINEGFATYLHFMFEAEHFEASFEETMLTIYAQLIAVDELPPMGIEIEDLFGLTVYFRGAVTLHALRRHIGDETFFEILRTHYDRSAGGTTNTEEFLALVDEFAGPEAVAVVESWLFDDTVPASL